MADVHTYIKRLFEKGHDAPPPELFHDQRVASITNFRPAAVLVAVTERSEPGVLFLQRPLFMKEHPGQIALPGGKLEPGEDPTNAALREAWEEMGIQPSKVNIVGETDIYRTGSGFEITPVIATIPGEINIRPNPAEVTSWFEAPLGYLLDPRNQRTKWVDWEGAPRRYYEIKWKNHMIWGVTAAMLVNLSRRLRWP